MIDFRLYLVTDRSLAPAESLSAVISEACAEGVRAVQLREKALPDRELYEIARELRALTGELKAALLVNDRADIAGAVHADGVHCPEAGLPVDVAQRLLPSGLVGKSVHSVEGARRAREGGREGLRPRHRQATR